MKACCSERLDGEVATLARCSSDVAITKKTFLVYVCERCTHEWIPRQEGVQPSVCPSCKNPNWAKPNTNPKGRKAKKKAKKKR